MNSILRIPLSAWSFSAIFLLGSMHHFASSVQAQLPGLNGDWNVNASGNWTDVANWTALDTGTDYPSGVGATAIVVHAIGGDRNITLDTAVTLGTLRLGDNNASHDFFLVGPNTLTFDNGGAGALFDNNSATAGQNPSDGNRIHVAVQLNDNLIVDSDRNLEFRSAWTGTGAETLTLTNTNTAGVKNGARFLWQTSQGGSLSSIDVLNILYGEARFDGTNGTLDSQLIGANTINLGNGELQADGEPYPILYLLNTETTQTATLNVNGGFIRSDLGTNDIDIWSGDINFTGPATSNIFDVNDAGGADIHTISGVIGGTGGFSKVNAGTIRSDQDNTIQGDIYIQRNGVGGTNVDSTVSRGGIRLGGADGAFSQAASLTMSRDGALYLDNSVATNNNRVNDAAPITLRGGGRIRVIGNAAAGTTETFGALTQDTGSGKINMSLNTTTPQAMDLTFSSYTRDVGTITQFMVLEDLPGSFGSPLPSTAARVFITDGGATTTQFGSGGANGTTTRSIVLGAFGGVNNVSNHFMTFDSLAPTELRPLVWDGTPVGSEYFLSREAGTLSAPHQFTVSGLVTNDQNVLINFNTDVSKDGEVGTGLGGGSGWFGNAPIAILEDVAMNSLRFGTNTPTNGSNTNEIGSALVLAPGATLYLGDKAAISTDPGETPDNIGAITTTGSGMILFGRDITGTAPGSNQYIAGGFLDFGTREALIVNESGNSAFIRSGIIGSGGLTKAGANSVYFDNSNSYAGVTHIAEGSLIIRDQHGLGNSHLVRIDGGGQLLLELGSNVLTKADGSAAPDLFIGAQDASRSAIYSNNSNNTWGGDIIVDNLDDLGNTLFDVRLAVNARDTLNINGNIYGNELGSDANGIAANPINPDIVLNDARYVTTNGSNSAGGILNLNGQFMDNQFGAIAEPVTAANENEVLRFRVRGSNQMVVNARQRWNAAGQILVEQGLMRYEGEGNFWTDQAATNMNAANGQSGLRIGGNINNADAAFVLTKPGQNLNISRIDIGGDGTNNWNSLGNSMLAGTNTSGTVTFGDGTDRVVYLGSNASNAFRRDLAAYQIGGGTMELNFRLDDTDNDALTSFTKVGRGVVNYNGQNGTANGDVEILYMSGGLLRLTNYGNAEGRRFDNGAKLVLAGGGIEMDTIGATSNQTAQYTSAAISTWTGTSEVLETLVSAGGTDVIVTAGAFDATMNIGSATVPLTRNKGGTVNFVENVTGAGASSITLQGQPADPVGPPVIVSVIQANDTAYGWATYGDSYTFDPLTATYTLNAIDFAATTGAGEIGAFAGPNRQNADDVTLWTAGFDVSEDTSGFNGGLAGSAVNTIHFDFDGAGSITAPNDFEVTSGGIMVSSAVLSGAKTITGGSINAGIDTDLIVHHYGGADMTISSVIQDNVGSGAGNALVKTGSGNLVLTGTNTYTGGTYLNGGQLTISDNSHLGATPVAVDPDNIYGNGGTLRVLSDVNLNANRGMTLGGNGIEVSVGPASTLTYNGLIASEPHLVPGYGANPAVGRLDKTGLGTLLLTREDNTYTGLTDVREGTLKLETLTPPAQNAVMNAFGSTLSYLDGTIVRSGATLAIHPTTAANNSNRTFVVEEWLTFEGGSTLDVAPVNSMAEPHDFNLLLRGILNFDAKGNAGTMDGFVTPSSLAGSTVVDVARRAVQFNDDGGYITGDGHITKTGAGNLYFRENSPEWTGQLTVLQGEVRLFGAGNKLGTGNWPVILGHNLLAEQAGEVVSGNTTVTLVVADEGGYRDSTTVFQDIIVRNDEGAGSQTKRIGARNLANIDEVNFAGTITLRDDLQLFYQDDSRDSSITNNTSQVTNSTRSIGTLTNLETVFINFNGSFIGGPDDDITTSVAQGGNANATNGSIDATGDDLVIRAVFGLNGDNSGWAGNLIMGSAEAGGDVDEQHVVTFGNPLAISAQNDVTIRSDGTLRVSGNDITIGSLTPQNANTNNFIENSSATSPGSLTITQETDATVDVRIRDGETVFILKPGESYQSLSLVKAGSAMLELTKENSFTGTTTLAGGTLRLGYEGDHSMLADGANLILNDGILDLAGTAAHSETVLGTVLNGTAAIERSTGSSTINLNTITRNAGTLRIGADNIATTDNLNTNGILDGWMTVDGNWAVNSTNGADGLIVGLAAFDQEIDRLSGGTTQSIVNGATNNVNIIEAGSAANPITLAAAGTTSVNTLRQGADGSTVNGPTGPAVVDIGAGNILRITSGGVLLPDGSSSLTFNPTGTLTAGDGDNTAGTLFLQSQDTDTDLLTSQKLSIGTVIADNGSGVVDVRTAGPGVTVFTGANIYTGETLVGSGILAVGATDGLGTTGTLGGGDVTVEASAVLAFNRADAGLVVSGALQGGGTVAQNGVGTTTLSGAAPESQLNYVAVRGTIAAGADNAINTTGSYTFGETAGSTETSTLDLTNGSATIGSLLVQTNAATANSLVIGAGKTLTVNGGVLVGVNENASDTALTATGGGNLVVNSGGANFQLGGATGADNENEVTVDLSGLSSFTADLGAGNLRVGDENTSSGANASTLILAANNTITSGHVQIGEGSGAQATHTLQLGSGANIINSDLISLGSSFDQSRSGGQMIFDGADTTGTLQIRGSDGTGLAAINMINTTGNTGNNMISLMDLAGHTADITASTLVMAQRGRNSGNATSILNFDQGTLNVRDLTMASRFNNTGTQTSTGDATATLNLGDSAAPGTPTVTIGQINMASNTSNGGAVSATINISGGSVTIGNGLGDAINMANAVAGRTVSSNINLTGGSTTITDHVVRTGGAGTENATINLDGGVLDMSGSSIGTAAEGIAFVAASGTLRNLGELNGGGVLDKTTSGTLVLDTANTYTGGTTVSEGTLLVNNTSGSGTGSGSVTVALGATLGGSGMVGGTSSILGAHSPGTSPGIQAFGSDLTYSGGASTLIWELASNTATPGDRGGFFDGIDIGGNLDFAGATNATLSFNSLGSSVDWSDALWGSNQEWLVYDVAGTTSNFPNLTLTTSNWADANGLLFSDVFLGSGFAFTQNGSDVYLNYTFGSIIPEPSRAMLILLGLVGLTLRRRRA